MRETRTRPSSQQHDNEEVEGRMEPEKHHQVNTAAETIREATISAPKDSCIVSERLIHQEGKPEWFYGGATWWTVPEEAIQVHVRPIHV